MLFRSFYVEFVFILHLVKCFQVDFNSFHKLNYGCMLLLWGNWSLLRYDIDIVS